ncbi:MAG: 2-amino-4-hydroxy-6-hydroxymethyldihydropteridine diphosphokinase [Mycobacterium sp.]
MTAVVLSIGSNVGDRLAYLQSVLDGLGPAVRGVSPVYETDAWGGVEQGPFLNAVLIADDPSLNCHGWLRRGHELEQAADRKRERHWGPRTLDVDLITCQDGADEVWCEDEVLTLPHPYAHQRAFVLIPWLALDPGATLPVGGASQPVAELLAGLSAAERDGVRLVDHVLVS